MTTVIYPFGSLVDDFQIESMKSERLHVERFEF